jgi:hypothetical protein
MTERDRDLVHEAIQIIEGSALLVPERAHLVALHHYWKTIRDNLMTDERVKALLRKLDAEHVHEVVGRQGECETCQWLHEQPEWAEIVEEWRGQP